jgi:hypothetical protein
MASTRMRLFLTVAGRPISEILETRYSCSCRVSCECENPRWRINVNGKEGGVGVGRQAANLSCVSGKTPLSVFNPARRVGTPLQQQSHADSTSRHTINTHAQKIEDRKRDTVKTKKSFDKQVSAVMP